MSGARLLLGLIVTALLLHAVSAAQARGRSVRTDGPDWLACAAALGRVQPGSGFRRACSPRWRSANPDGPTPTGTAAALALGDQRERPGPLFPSKDAAIALCGRAAAESGQHRCGLHADQPDTPPELDSLEQVFEPMTNVAYGARFLRALQDETGCWEGAVARYHNAEPVRGPGLSGAGLCRRDKAPEGGLARRGRIVTAAPPT